MHEFTKCLIHHYVFHVAIASDQGTHFIANEVWKLAHFHRIHWSYYVSQHSEVAGIQNSIMAF